MNALLFALVLLLTSEVETITVNRDQNWFLVVEPNPTLTFSQQDVDDSENTTWIVKFKNKADAGVADVCNNETNPCSCEDGAAGSRFGLAMLTCPGTDAKDLVAFLNNLPYEVVRVEEDKRYFGGSANLPDPSSIFEANSLTCGLTNRFNNFPQINPANWGLDRCDQSNSVLDNTYDVTEGLTGCGVHIYVMDSGIYAAHEEFQGRIQHGWNAVTRSSNPHDDNGHGTHCIGIVAGRNSGVAKDAYIHAVKALDHAGIGTSSRIFGGLEWIYDDITTNGRLPAVLSLSIAAPGEDQTMNEIMKEFYDAGVFVVVASGNYNRDACAFTPANSNHVFTVGATEIDNDLEDIRSSFSNFGACVDVWAPGKSIRSAGNESPTSYILKSGTSMAAPFISGIAALYLQNHPSASPATLQDILKEGFIETPTIITKEKSADLIEDAPLMCSINTLETCTNTQACQVSVIDTWSSCPPSHSVCGQHLQVKHLQVDQQPACGGARCPDLTEYKDCTESGFIYVPCDRAIPAQWFPVGDITLSHKIWHLLPLADDSYTSCFKEDSPIAPEIHPTVSASNLLIADDSSTEYTLPAKFKFFGHEYSSIHIGSNGYLTFGFGDFRYASVPEGKPLVDLVAAENFEDSQGQEIPPSQETESFGEMIDYSSTEYQGEILDDFQAQDNLASTDTHWDKKRISAWFQDLDPSTGSAKISVQHVTTGENRVVINYEDIPCYADNGALLTSTFQLVLWLEGSSLYGNIQIWWGDLMNCKGSVVGLSPGYKPTGWQSSILNTDVSQCGVDGHPLSPPAPPSGSPEEPYRGQERGGGSSSFSLFS